MILLVEPVHFGPTHVRINSAFIAMFKQCVSKSEIKIFVEYDHYKSLKNNLTDDFRDIEANLFKKYSKEGRLYWFQKIFGEWKIITKTFLKVYREKPERLIWLSLFPTGHLLVQLIHRIFFPKLAQIIVLHGELEYLGANNEKKVDKCLAKILKTSLGLANHKTQYILLGDSILNNYLDLNIKSKAQFDSITHPFLYSEAPLITKEQKSPLVVGTFGALNFSKSAHFIFLLAQRFAKEIELGKIRFITVGKVNDDIKKFKNQLVECYKEDQFITQEEMEQQISALNISLFFYDHKSYKLTASGAMHESVNLKIPFIAIKNDYFNSFVDRYNVGICVDGLDEMEIEIRNRMDYDNNHIDEIPSAIIMYIKQNSFPLQTLKLSQILG